MVAAAAHDSNASLEAVPLQLVRSQLRRNRTHPAPMHKPWAPLKASRFPNRYTCGTGTKAGL